MRKLFGAAVLAGTALATTLGAASAQQIYTYGYDRGIADPQMGRDWGVGRDAYGRGYRLGLDEGRLFYRRGYADRDEGLYDYYGYGELEPGLDDRELGYGPYRYGLGGGYGYGAGYGRGDRGLYGGGWLN